MWTTWRFLKCDGHTVKVYKLPWTENRNRRLYTQSLILEMVDGGMFQKGLHYTATSVGDPQLRFSENQHTHGIVEER